MYASYYVLNDVRITCRGFINVYVNVVFFLDVLYAGLLCQTKERCITSRSAFVSDGVTGNKFTPVGGPYGM